MRLQTCRLFLFFSLIASLNAQERETHPLIQRVTIAHQEGINAYSGFGTNYTSGSIFLSPNYRMGSFMPFIDGRIHRFDNHTYSANIGFGGRYIPTGESICHLIGGSLYYDYRKGHNWSYNQIGIGFESLGKYFDSRVNFYIPFGKTKYSAYCVYDYDGDWFAIHSKCESVSFGFNGEVGFTTPSYKGFLLYAATGPYYFSGKCLDHSTGWELRVRPQYKDYFAIDFKIHYDKLYHTVYQTTFILSVPIYQLNSKANRPKPCGITDRQIYQPVIRLETMPITRRSCWFCNF